MIWLTWRQYRKATLYTLLALAVLAAVMIPSGLAMHHAFNDLGLAQCTAALGSAQLVSQAAARNCGSLGVEFTDRFGSMAPLGILFVVLPALAGLFVGAPLVSRELEQGTQRLVWTQGISRRRWILARFGLVGAGALILAAVYALGVAWWSGPLVKAGGGRFNGVSFDVQGVVPVGYTLFAVALGVFAGTVWHRVLPAMGATLAGFVLVRALVETLARPHFMTPATLTYPLTSTQVTNPMAGDWIYSSGVGDAVGQHVGSNGGVHCSSAGGGPVPVGGCGALAKALPNSFNWVRYQPGDRFWAFQGIEAGIFVALAALLILLAVRRLGRIS